MVTLLIGTSPHLLAWWLIGGLAAGYLLYELFHWPSCRVDQ